MPPNESIFYEGQIFDAHQFVSGLIRTAEKSIILIDNYIDESVLVLFSKRKINVTAIIYTRTISAQLNLDIVKFNSQYSGGLGEAGGNHSSVSSQQSSVSSRQSAVVSQRTRH